MLWVWSYPAVSEEQRKVIMRKTPLTTEDKVSGPPSFVYGQFKRLWYYVMTVYVQGLTTLPKVSIGIFDWSRVTRAGAGFPRR